MKQIEIKVTCDICGVEISDIRKSYMRILYEENWINPHISPSVKSWADCCIKCCSEIQSFVNKLKNNQEPA